MKITTVGIDLAKNVSRAAMAGPTATCTTSALRVAVAEEIEQLAPATTAKPARQQPKRQPLPENLPRREVRHEPDSTTCACGCQMKRIGARPQ